MSGKLWVAVGGGYGGAEWVVCLKSGRCDGHWAPGFCLPCFYLPSLRIWKLFYSENKAQGNLCSYSFGCVLMVST